MISLPISLLTQRRRLVLALAVVPALLTAAPAKACQYDFAPEPIGGSSARFILPRMFAAASFVDLALAEGSQAIGPFRGTRVASGPYPKVHSFRVIQRWKGNSTDRFILFGAEGDGKRGSDMTHWTDERGRIYPYTSVRETPPGEMGPGNSCSPPPLAAKSGSIHIVFREADGRLLGAVPFHEGMRNVAGTSIAEIDPLWLSSSTDNSDWVREAQSAGAYADRWKLPLSPAVPDRERATVRFRKPLGSSAVEALLAQAGAVPFGVTLVRGGQTMDYRLVSEIAASRLINDALFWAQRTGTPRQALTALAGKLVDVYTLSSLYPEGSSYRFATYILRLAREPDEQVPVLITAVQVVASPAVQQILGRRADIAEVIGGRRIRQRVAIESPSSQAAPPLLSRPRCTAGSRTSVAETCRSATCKESGGS